MIYLWRMNMAAEDQKVAEWMESLGYGRSIAIKGWINSEKEYLSSEQANFFYNVMIRTRQLESPMNKMFEEELTLIIIAHTNVGEERMAAMRKAILAAHQTEMDRVANKTIGNQRCTGECTSPYGLETRPFLQVHSYACIQVRTRVKEQRARYKAMKEY